MISWPVIAALALIFFATALLYSMVGNAGASGFLAAMALFGLAPEVMKPTALTLNILVAAIATVKYAQAGHFSWQRFWPFALASIPSAFLGGMVALPARVFQPLVAAVLLYAAYRLFFAGEQGERGADAPIPRVWGLALGAVIGFVSGLTGVGGGIFLGPILLLKGWAEARQAMAISAAFILVNSLAGLLGNLSSVADLPPMLPVWAAAAAAGGYAGAEYGSRRLGNQGLKRVLGAVLVVASLRLLLPG